MKYFSTKIATDQVFCNRTAERAEVIRCIQTNEHCVVVAPRRYGKTSLIMQAITESNATFALVDLFCVVYEEEVIRKIAQGVSQVAQTLMTRTDKTLNFLESIFNISKIGLRAGGFDISAQFNKTTPALEHIEDLLKGLEKIAAKAQQPVVFFIDEFQDILKVDQSPSIQAAIRSVAQHSQYVTYIFSGSSRVMLEKIFEDANQPLYMMCHTMRLERIAHEHFVTHIQTAAKATWGIPLPETVVAQILQLTECHTYYVNALCSELIIQTTPPDTSTVDTTWSQLMLQYKGKIVAELEKLSSNRIKVLTNIALLGAVSEPNSKAFLNEVRISLSSTQSAIQYLLEHDYLYEPPIGGLRLIDPLIKSFIVQRQT